MSSFEEAYRALNVAQKQAVDAIDGPVMVVAGPGTGKTQLLSMRVANILKQTDSLPSNILCLTFTESGALAMRQRLISLMGQEAYKVAIHTFHSFGTEVINHNPEYFHQGAHFRAADELSSYEVLEEIFKKLAHSNPFSTTMNGTFTAIRDAQSAIGDLKKSGLTPDELLKILDHNHTFVAFAEPIIAQAFDTPRLTKSHIAGFEDVLAELGKFQHDKFDLPTYKPLFEVCLHQFEHAVNEALQQGSTKALTAWRNKWCEKDAHKKLIFKDHKINKKLRALANIYNKYLLGMQERELFDFDDMILRVVHALEIFAELRFNLQEQYQYILVDEFQDTNGAQLRLLQNLTNSEAANGRPNIMVVGDDDQAIYRFQGADLSNILEFKDLYTKPEIITLTENYRSTSAILTTSRDIITQGTNRLETTLDSINKTLHANHTSKTTAVESAEFKTPADEYQWIAQKISALTKQGISPNQIAVLGRNHKHLLAILPYLGQADIRVTYERRENVLDAPHIQSLTLFANIVVAIGNQRYDIVDELLPQLLAQPFWGISHTDLWQLSLDAYKQRRLWLELMLDSGGKLHDIAEFIIVNSHLAQTEPLEAMLDILIGGNEQQVGETEASEMTEPFGEAPREEYISPFRAYYFNAGKLDKDPTEYLALLSNLTTIRRKLREYRPDQALNLEDFVNFVELHRKTGIHITDTSEHRESKQAIKLMTAHKSKGLEFDVVFVLNCADSVWGSSARGYHNSISFPQNLPIQPAGETDDDRLRLFYVAATRARDQLFLTYSQADANGKQTLRAQFLQLESLQPKPYQHDDSPSTRIKVAETTWHDTYLAAPKTDQQTLLAPLLERYSLSATHLNNFIDLTKGGPQAFLLQNLLRFPQAMTPSAIFGSAVHSALQRAHGHLTATGQRKPVEDVLHDFEKILQDSRLNSRDYDYLHEKGSDVLSNFLAHRYDSFHAAQIVERSFANQGVVIGQAKLTGTIDKLEVDADAKTIIITDYKTGKAAATWRGETDYEKVKLHKYRQQLMLYKLLIENSRDYNGYTVIKGVVEFVEPAKTGEIHCLSLEFDAQELAEFQLLIQAVWQRIMTLDLPDTSQHEPTHKGILAFEQQLLGEI